MPRVKSEPVCGDHSAHRRDMRAFRVKLWARNPTLADFGALWAPYAQVCSSHGGGWRSTGSPWRLGRRRRRPDSLRLALNVPPRVCSLASVPRLCRVPCPREFILISPRAPSLSEDRATAKLLSTAGGREKIHVVLLHARPRAGESGQESGNRNTAECLEHLCGLAISEMFARYRCLLL